MKKDDAVVWGLNLMGKGRGDDQGRLVGFVSKRVGTGPVPKGCTVHE